MSEMFHGRNQFRKKRNQSLGTDAIRSLPQLDQRLPDTFVIPRGLSRPLFAPLSSRSVQKTDRVLAAVASRNQELVQDLGLLSYPCESISFRYAFEKLAARIQAHLFPHCCTSNPNRYSRLRSTILPEATARIQFEFRRGNASLKGHGVDDVTMMVAGR